jgi:hypothetical protein
MFLKIFFTATSTGAALSVFKRNIRASASLAAAFPVQRRVQPIRFTRDGAPLGAAMGLPLIL